MSCPCPVPGSYVPEPLCSERINNYQVLKYPVLNNWVNYMSPGVNEEINLPYTAEQFKELVAALQAVPSIGGVRVYFSSYKQNSPLTDNYIPPGKKNLLTLIYAATDSNMNDTGDYFNVDYTATTPAPAIKTLTRQMASSWVEYYQANKLYLLQQEGMKTNPYFLETKSLWYPISDLTDWLCIVNCSGEPDSPVVTNVQACFAAYNLDEDYPNQLSLIFEMLDNNGGTLRKIPLEKFSWFKKKVETLKEGEGGYDTGNPCPPLPGCQGSSLPA